VVLLKASRGVKLEKAMERWKEQLPVFGRQLSVASKPVN
jgi:hypothetical protein